MTAAEKRRDAVVTAAMKALSHPRRRVILAAVMRDGEISAARHARKIGDDGIGVTAYHVHYLADLGVLRLERETPVRGAIEHHYRPDDETDAGAAVIAMLGAIENAIKNGGDRADA